MEEFPKEPSPENVEEGIRKLFDTLYSGYAGEAYNQLTPELQEQWYEVEMEAEVSGDREAAKTHLEEFLKVLGKKKEIGN